MVLTVTATRFTKDRQPFVLVWRITIAKEIDNLPVVKSLLDARAEVDAKDISGLVPLHLAAKDHDLDAVKLRLQAGADPGTQDHTGKTALHYAAGADRFCMSALGIVSALVACGADVNARDDNSKSALHLAAAKGHEELVKRLLYVGADIESATPNGWTPLHFAVVMGKELVVTLLVAHGANLAAKGIDGHSIRRIAVAFRHPELLAVLKDTARPDTEEVLDGTANSERGSGISDERVALVQTMTDTSAGARELLRRFITDDDLGNLKLCAEWRKDVVAEEYPWAWELLDDGYPEDEILNLIIKSENLGWTGPDTSTLPSTAPFDTATLKHQTQCAHYLAMDDVDSVTQQAGTPGVEYGDAGEGVMVQNVTSADLHTCLPKQDAPLQLMNPERALQKLEEREQNLIKICGVAGVFPPESPRRLNPGYALFHRRVAKIVLGEMEGTADIRVKVGKAVEEVLTNVLNGLRFLNNEGGCCSTFTYLVKSHRRPKVVELRNITAKALEDIRRVVKRISSLDQDFSTLREAPIQHCVDALNNMGLHHLSTAILRHTEDARPSASVISCLHACAVIAQIAALSLVFYSRAHSREFHCDWITRPIELFQLAGLGGKPSLSVYAERLELACMGKMLGRKVWVFNEELQRPVTTDTHYLLSTNVANLLDTWGGGMYIQEEDPSSVISLLTGGGTIVQIPEDETSKFLGCKENHEIYCHWQSDYVSSDVQLEPFRRTASLLIGATSVNSKCPLTHANCHAAIVSKLENIDCRPPSWKTAARNVGAAVGVRSSSSMEV